MEEKEISFEGRCIGGCLDVLLAFAGTCYDATLSFIHQYQQDGFIWYFDIFDLTPVSLSLALFKLKTLGWFKNVKGFLIGRSLMQNNNNEYFTFKDAVERALRKFNVPIVYNVDTGHIPPQMCMINGSYAVFEYNDGKGKLTQKLI